jgi:hypothetical protein
MIMPMVKERSMTKRSIEMMMLMLLAKKNGSPEDSLFPSLL